MLGCSLYREAAKTSGRKYNTGPKQKIQDGADADNASGPPYIMWAASISSICFRLYFLCWPHLVWYFWADWIQPSILFQLRCIILNSFSYVGMLTILANAQSHDVGKVSMMN